MLFHIKDSSKCANTNEPRNPPSYDNKAGTDGQRKGNHLRCREKQDVQTWSQTTLRHFNEPNHD